MKDDFWLGGGLREGGCVWGRKRWRKVDVLSPSLWNTHAHMWSSNLPRFSPVLRMRGVTTFLQPHPLGTNHYFE